MGTSELPPRQDAVDDAVRELLEYVTLSDLVEGELNAITPDIRRVIVALLAAEDAADRLTPYRKELLDRIRTASPRDAAAADPA